MDDLAVRELDHAAVAEAALAATGVQRKMFAPEQFAQPEVQVGGGSREGLAAFRRLDNKIRSGAHVGRYVYTFCTSSA